MIQNKTGAVHIWADEERKDMFAEPQHTPEESRELYTYLNARTAELLAEGKSVIFDTNFNFYKDRQHMREIAARHGAEAILIWVTTKPELAKNRAIHDAENQPTRLLGDMTPETWDRIASHLQPPSENENVIKIDGREVDETRLAELLHI
jgi:predicted kinase